MTITAASDVAANGLDRDDYITLLAKGTGLPSQQVEATKTAWDGLEMTAPIFVMPGESGARNFRRGITTEVSRDGERSASAVAVICLQVAEGILDRLPDPSATQPDDWDEAEDGPWSPPTIPNPDSARNNLYWVKKLEDGENFGDPPFRTLDEHTSTLDPSTVKDTAMAANQRISVGDSDL